MKNTIKRILKKKDLLINWGIIFLAALVVIFTVYSARQIFYFKYDPDYFENLYYTSQWNIPNSTRGISDGSLYEFVGYRLVQGENPFNINFEVPPFGKYFYGLAEATIGNPYWLSVALYFGSIAIFYLLTKELFEEKRLRYLSVFLFVTTPFFATQIREVMLDLPLMFLYLVQSLFFVRYLKEKDIKNLLLSAVFLGLATGTKPGVYTPFVFLAGEALIFFVKSKKAEKLRSLIAYPLFIAGGYVLSYFPYFIRHPNPIPWLRLHQKVFDFYLGSGLGGVNHLNQWKGIFINSYEGWWQPGKSTTIGDWSPLLPIAVVAMVYILYKGIKEKKFVWVYLSLVTVAFLFVNTFIPFFSRYLMPLIPLFVLFTTKVFRKVAFIVFFLALLNLPFYNQSVNDKNPAGDVNTTARFISTMAYRDLYKSLRPEDQENIPEEEFINANEYFYQTLGVREISAKVDNISSDAQKASASAQITLTSMYGTATNDETLHYQRIHNQWRLIWDWDYLWPGYSPSSKIAVALASTQPKLMVYMIPQLMYDWTKGLDSLSKVTGESTISIDRTIRRVVPDKFPRFVGYLDTDESKALAIPGVSLVKDDSGPQTRVYILGEKGEKTQIPFKSDTK